MAIATLDDIKDQLAFTDDLGRTDDALLQRKLDAAQQHLERLLGFRIEDTFGGADQDPVPPVLVEAVCQLAAWWYEQRETAVTGAEAKDIPFGVRDIVDNYREWCF